MMQKINAIWGEFMQSHGDICELREGAKTRPGGEKCGRLQFLAPSELYKSP